MRVAREKRECRAFLTPRSPPTRSLWTALGQGPTRLIREPTALLSPRERRCEAAAAADRRVTGLGVRPAVARWSAHGESACG
jgi:hypothetical protein